MYKTIIHTSSLDDETKNKFDVLAAGEFEQAGHCLVFHHPQAVSRDKFSALSNELKIDINTLPENFEPGRVQLLVTDMDSTLINIECVDEIADFAGVKPQVKAITEAAMRGELDFAGSLMQRVSLLKGLDQSVLQLVYDNRLKLNPGADAMLTCLKSRDIKVALVSGGFTFFTDKLKSRLKLDFTQANVLEIKDNQLVGSVVGDIVGAEAKRAFLLSLCDELGIDAKNSLAMGDGANDLLMMDVAGLSVAYHAKPGVQQAADMVINHSGLDVVCDLFQL